MLESAFLLKFLAYDLHKVCLYDQHIKGQGRHQVTQLHEALDDFVTEDNPVRVVDIFVDGLQLDALGFERVNAKQSGRSGYHPATKLKLYIYG